MIGKLIRIEVVCPGWVNTESNRVEIAENAKKEGILFNEKMKQISDSITLKRFIEPREVANLVAFLVDSTGSGITGQIYEIK